jgi:hypothetical protein
MVKLLAEHKAEVLSTLANIAHEAELLAPTPLFRRVISGVEGEPALELPCAARRGRAARLVTAGRQYEDATCQQHKDGLWKLSGFGVEISHGKPPVPRIEVPLHRAGSGSHLVRVVPDSPTDAAGLLWISGVAPAGA